ncbi:MAG TPA: hypothetical protein VFH25_01505 [Nitrososphaeraceae archaeon]|nr:hypothetical protein [Nitrososphaeraceae archaeon]
MTVSREEKENLVLELYYKKDYRYRDIAKELKMSPNQIREIIKRHEDKNEAIANKKKMLSLSSQAYKLFSDGRTNVQVAIKLDIPQAQVTQFRLEYWRLKDQDSLERLYTGTKGNVAPLGKLHNELVVKRGMSYEKVANLVDIAINKLPYVENLYEQAKWAADKEQARFDSLGNRIRSLDEEEKRRKKMITLHPSSYYYANAEDHVTNKFPYNAASRQPSSLSNMSSVNYDEYIEKWI